MPERIIITASFRPKDPLLPDRSRNINVRNKSQHSELYRQWATYRLDVLAARARHVADELRRHYQDNVLKTDGGRHGHCLVETVNYVELESRMGDQIKYMKETLFEMRPIGRTA